MATFYKGVARDTPWHNNDWSQTGLTPQSPGTQASIDKLMKHITGTTGRTPYISLTRSYGVAWTYAVIRNPTAANPGYIYEIEITDPVPAGLRLLDPVKELAQHLPGPLDSVTYHHDSLPLFLLGLVDPIHHGRYLGSAFHKQPPPATGTLRTPYPSLQLETLVRALRDAEILAAGNIPSNCVERSEVYI